MPVKDMKRALGNSLLAEEEAVNKRFERAETVLARNDIGPGSGLGGSVESSQGAAATEGPNSRKGSIPGGRAPLVAPQDEGTRVKRDSFTMPVADYEQIAGLQQRCLQTHISASKSEVLRAGLAALCALKDDELAAIMRGLPKVKTGRRRLNVGG